MLSSNLATPEGRRRWALHQLQTWVQERLVNRAPLELLDPIVAREIRWMLMLRAEQPGGGSVLLYPAEVLLRYRREAGEAAPEAMRLYDQIERFGRQPDGGSPLHEPLVHLGRLLLAARNGVDVMRLLSLRPPGRSIQRRTTLSILDAGAVARSLIGGGLDVEPSRSGLGLDQLLPLSLPSPEWGRRLDAVRVITAIDGGEALDVARAHLLMQAPDREVRLWAASTLAARSGGAASV